MKKILLFAALMMTAVLYATDVVVYENTFVTASQTNLDNVAQGTPTTIWNYAQNVIEGDAPVVPRTNSSYLQIAARKATGSNGQNMVKASLANFATPFTAKLSEIEADSLVWTFNMRYNYEYCTGFDGTIASRRGIAAILAMDNEDFLAGNGYAIVDNQTGYYKLARIDGGLSVDDNVAIMLSSPKMTALTDPAVKLNCRFMALKVVFVPATSTWRFFYAPGPSNSFVDPAEAEWVEAEGGPVVDDTHTSKSMTHFGFLNKYSGKVDATLFVKNYKVMAYGYNPEPPAPVDPVVGEVMYENTFTTASQTNLDNVAQGTPGILWNYAQNVINGDAPAVPNTTSDYLQIAAKKATDYNGQNMVKAPLAFNAPFNAKLSEIAADSVVWTFNMRYNYDYCNGFDGSISAQRGIAAILAMDNEDFLAGNGYAIVDNQTGYYKLARIDGGLSANANVVELASTPKLTKNDGTGTSNKRYMTLRVTYIPSSDTWKMYYFANTENSFVAPDDVETWTLAGSVVDDTHTSKSMTHFGFLNKYYGNVDATLFVKNYKVMAYGYTPAPAVPATYVKMYTCNFGADSKTELDNYKAGTPKVLWTNTKYNYGTADNCPTPYMQNGLIVPGLKADDSKGRNILAAPMAGLGYPWTAKMNESEADSLVWMFNMYYNYDYTGGFDDSQRGIATVLAMDGSDMMTANGYAIVNNQSCYYKLVRFDGGLSANANVVELASTPKLTKNDGTDSSNKRYMTFRVVYVPATNMWKMYYFANTENAFVAPANVETWTLAGSVMDVAHTGKSMTHFGFMNNYVQVATFDAAMTIKNFSLNACFESVDAIALDENRYNGHILDVVDGETVDVALTRNLHAGSYNTLCLPFAMTAYQIETAFGANAKLAKFFDASMDNESLTLDFDDTVTEIEAGVPYIIQPAADITAPVVLSDMAISKTASKIDFSLAKMTGILSPTALAEGVNTLYLGANNTLYTVEAGSDPLPGMRAYFTLSDAAALAPVRTLRIGKQTPTALDEVSGEVRCTKVLRDGQIIILKGDKLYNIIGQAIH